jgi:ribosomal protein S18 acetylase RimI-like enzyme
MTSITIRHGFPEAARGEAAAVYDAAFRRKLSPFLGARETCIAILQAAFNPAYAISAFDGERLVGIAGLSFGGGNLLRVNFGTLARHFGALSAAWRYGLAALMGDRTPSKGQLVMDGLAVHPDMRGRGVGSALLDAVIAFARERGLATVRLDVVDTNPDARRLYERKHFVATATHTYGWITESLGFTGSTTMIYDLRQGRP